MKLCFVADARSPIALNWIRYFIDSGHEVHVISTYPCEASAISNGYLHIVPVGFSSFPLVQQGSAVRYKTNSVISSLWARLRSGRLAGSTTFLHHSLTPFDLYRQVVRVRNILSEIKPDLIHAMRIAFNGILASRVAEAVPLVLSSWGNDFTLIADKYPFVGRLTRHALSRADALHCDCFRDLRLASSWGWSGKLDIVLPGAGGIDREVFYPSAPDRDLLARLSIPHGAPVIINPRSFRTYVRNDVFFRSISLVLKRHPDTLFLTVGMAGNPVARSWLRKLDIAHAVRMTPPVPQPQMAELFRLASITVSPSEHDGTPNTLLEAMACGCFPIAGDIESLREWITNGVNGLLCDPSSPESLADAVVRALEDEDLRRHAAGANQKLIDERADYQQVMKEAEKFYLRVIETGKRVEACVG